MRRWLKAALLFVLIMAGCRVEDYNVVIKNVGSREIDRAHVLYGGFRSVGGVIIPGASAGHGNPNQRIPATATVGWRTEDGVMHKQDVEVRKLVPKGFRGDIVFEIANDDTVTVRIVPRKKISY